MILSCNDTSKSDYKYSDGLIRFLNEQSEIELGKLEGQKLLFVDISCEECVVSKLDFLKQDSEFYNIKIYLLGDTTGSVLAKEFKSIVIGYDLESKYHLYETGISLPLFIDTNKGRIKEHFTVNDFNQFEILKYLDESMKE